eukprot:87467_1
MGNEFNHSVNYDNATIDRTNWNVVSHQSNQELTLAKQEFHQYIMQCSFDNVPYLEYEFYKQYAIQTHLVERLRPRFNDYVKCFGAKPKWVKLSEPEKHKYKKYQRKLGPVYFCDLTIGKSVKQKLCAEINLYKCLRSMDINEINSLGWIVSITKNELPIPNIVDMPDNADTITIGMTEHYQKYVTTQNGTETYESSNQSSVINVRRSRRKLRKLHQSLNNFCDNEDDSNDDDYVPQQNKRRRES